MPSVQPSAALNYRAFLNETPRETEPAAPRATWLERAGRFSRKQGPWVALQRVVGGNVPIQGMLAAAGSGEGIRRIATEGVAGLIKRPALVAYAAKDGVSFAAEAALGPRATWVTRMPRWVARAVACAVAAPLDGLRGADLLPWLGRPDYEYPARCASSPRPTDCPSHTPGDMADWIEPVVAAVMIGAVSYWALPRLAYHLQQRFTGPAADAAPENDATPAAQASAAEEAAADIERGGLTQPLLPAPRAPGVSSRPLERAHSI